MNDSPRVEIRRLAGLALPVVGAQLATMLMGLVDTVMVGRFSTEALAAAALANVWIFGTIMFAGGVIFGLDPIVSQAHGAREGARAGRALQHGVVVALALSVPVALLWSQTALFLGGVGQAGELVAEAHRYTRVQIPGIPFLLVYFALRQYLQGRELVRPALWVILIANVFNVLFNWVLIFGHLGAPALGLYGAGIATAATRVLTLIGLVLYVRRFRLLEGAWVPWSRDAVDPRALARVFRIGLPVAVQMALEMWAFGAATLLAGRLGQESLAAHTIALNMASLTFMVPLGISQGAAIRVGNLLGARQPQAAQHAAWVALAVGAGVMAFAAVLFVVGRDVLPLVYTTEAKVVAACAAILPIAAAFQIFDGTQVVGCGILRGMGETRPAAVFNLVGYWILALPLGAWLALSQGRGLAGIWWGLVLGLAVVATALVVWVRVRGPARGPAAGLEALD